MTRVGLPEFPQEPKEPNYEITAEMYQHHHAAFILAIANIYPDTFDLIHCYEPTEELEAAIADQFEQFRSHQNEHANYVRLNITPRNFKPDEAVLELDMSIVDKVEQFLDDAYLENQIFDDLVKGELIGLTSDANERRMLWEAYLKSEQAQDNADDAAMQAKLARLVFEDVIMKLRIGV